MTDRESPCAAPDPRLTGLLDGELSDAERQRLEEHLRVCARCSRDLAQVESARRALRKATQLLDPPPRLGTRVQRGLTTEATTGVIQRRTVLFGGLAAALVLLAGGGTLLRLRSMAATQTLKRAVRAHRVETLGGPALGFVSSDPGAVSTWAHQQTGRPVEVPDFEGAGYGLRGARLESDVAAKAIAMVYESGSAAMTCTVLPPSGLPNASDEPRGAQIDGAGVVSWADEDAAYIMVANLPALQLLQLARMAQRGDSEISPSPLPGRAREPIPAEAGAALVATAPAARSRRAGQPSG